MSEPLIAIPKRHAIVFACFLVFYEFLTYIANDMIMPGMIHVVNSFNAPESMVATSLTLYILGGASLQLILGPISDAHGRRPLMIFGACLFLLFTLLIACSQSMNQFLAARFLQGMGLCFIGVIGYATIQEIFEEMDAIRFIAIMANAAILAPLAGPLLGAIVIHYTSWRYIFIVIAFFALLALWGLWHYMPEPIGQIKKNGEKIAAVPFSFNSVRSNYKALLKNPGFIFSALAAGLIGVPCIVWIALSPIILITEGGLSVIEYGLWQLPIFGSTILGNWFLHHLTRTQQMKPIIYIGCYIMMIGILLMGLLPYFFGNEYLYLIPGTIIYFFSLSIISAPLNRYSLYITSVSKGTASAVLSLSVMITAAIGIELANSVYSNHSNSAFGIYCIGVGGVFLLSLVLAFSAEKSKTAPK